MLSKALKSVQFGQAAQVIQFQDRRRHPVKYDKRASNALDCFLQRLSDDSHLHYMVVDKHGLPNVETPVLIRDFLPHDRQATQFERKLQIYGKMLGFLPGIAWEAHVGGLIVGAAIGYVLVSTREKSRAGFQVVGLATIVIILIAAWIFGNAGLVGLSA